MHNFSLTEIPVIPIISKVFLRICAEPGALEEIYVNYDNFCPFSEQLRLLREFLSGFLSNYDCYGNFCPVF
jgi:hypothetical protein